MQDSFADESRLGTGLYKCTDIWRESEFYVLSKFSTIQIWNRWLFCIEKENYGACLFWVPLPGDFPYFCDFGGNSLIQSACARLRFSEFQVFAEMNNHALLFRLLCSIDMEKRHKNKKKRALDPGYRPKMRLAIAPFLCTGRSDISFEFVCCAKERLSNVFWCLFR